MTGNTIPGIYIVSTGIHILRIQDLLECYLEMESSLWEPEIIFVVKFGFQPTIIVNLIPPQEMTSERSQVNVSKD